MSIVELGTLGEFVVENHGVFDLGSWPHPTTVRISIEVMRTLHMIHKLLVNQQSFHCLIKDRLR